MFLGELRHVVIPAMNTYFLPFFLSWVSWEFVKLWSILDIVRKKYSANLCLLILKHGLKILWHFPIKRWGLWYHPLDLYGLVTALSNRVQQKWHCDFQSWANRWCSLFSVTLLFGTLSCHVRNLTTPGLPYCEESKPYGEATCRCLVSSPNI